MHGDNERNLPTDGETAEVPPRLLSMKDAAISLGNITERHLRDLLDAKELQSVYIGRRRLVPLAEIDAYVARLLEGPSTKRAAA